MLRLALARALSDATCARTSSVSSVFFSPECKNFLFPPTGRETPDGKSEAVCAQINIHAALLFVKLFFLPRHLYLSGFGIEYVTRGERLTWRVFSSRISRRDRWSQISISLFKLTGISTKDFATFSLRTIRPLSIRKIEMFAFNLFWSSIYLQNRY